MLEDLIKTVYREGENHVIKKCLIILDKKTDSLWANAAIVPCNLWKYLWVHKFLERDASLQTLMMIGRSLRRDTAAAMFSNFFKSYLLRYNKLQASLATRVRHNLTPQSNKCVVRRFSPFTPLLQSSNFWRCLHNKFTLNCWENCKTFECTKRCQSLARRSLFTFCDSNQFAVCWQFCESQHLFPSP